MNLMICGVDPGIHTGYCLVEYLQEIKSFVIIEAGELVDEPEEVARYIASLPANVWAIESFLLSTQWANKVSHNDPHLLTVQVIGALRALIPVHQRVFQTPGSKVATPDEKLKELGLWKPSMHTRDAFRHAVFFTRSLDENKPVKHKKIKWQSSIYTGKRR